MIALLDFVNSPAGQVRRCDVILSADKGRRNIAGSTEERRVDTREKGEQKRKGKREEVRGERRGKGRRKREGKTEEEGKTAERQNHRDPNNSQKSYEFAYVYDNSII